MSPYTTFKTKCPACSEPMEFQSKSGDENDWVEIDLDELNQNHHNTYWPKDVLNINRHSPENCPKCNVLVKIALVPVIDTEVTHHEHL